MKSTVTMTTTTIKGSNKVAIATQLLLVLMLVTSSASACPSECNCDEATKKVTCALTNQTTFPVVPNWVQQLIVTGPSTSPNSVNITTLTADDLTNYVDLTELTITRLGITSIEEDTFTRLTDLQRIDLSYNQIETLPGGVFNALTKMKFLSLSYNQLTSITNTQLNFPALSVLTLKGNKIQLQDANVFQHLTKLHLLDVSDNFIGDPVPNFIGPTDLRIVNMQNCGIKTLSTSFRSFIQNAERLLLQNNQIRELPVEFAANLNNLAEFHLDGNSIEILKNNSFENIIAFQISLSNNKLKTIEPDAFAYFETGTLNLDNNELTDLPPKVFESIGTALKKLYLSDNSLGALNDNVFYGLTELTTLDLRNAKIQTISNDAFNGSKAEKLDLSQNNITVLSDGTMQSLALTEVNLMDNEWNCTEDLIPLRNWLLSNNQSTDCYLATAVNCLVCASPLRHEGRLVVNLTENDLITAMDPETTPEPTTTTEEPTTPTEEVTTPTEEQTTPVPVTDSVTSPEPEVTSEQPERSTPINKVLDAQPVNFMIIFVVAAATAILIIIVLICLLCKTCYQCREVSYPVGQKEMEAGHIPEVPDNKGTSVKLEHIFTINGHTNPGFKANDESFEEIDLGTSTTSLTTFRSPSYEPCRDSGIVGDSPGSDQSINKPLQAWTTNGSAGFGYENRTYSNLDEFT